MLRRLLPLALLLLFFARDARVEPNDPAARGLDMFVHMASTVASGGKVIVDLAAVGYHTTVDSRPLPGASFELGWNAESLGEGEHAPPDLKAQADAQGHAHVEIAVPEGNSKNIELLVAVRSKGHERTRSFTVNRTARASVRLAVSEAKVVPGGSVSAWVTARSVTTDMPLPEQKIALTLEEGTYRHASTIVETDGAGVASARMPIPFADNPRIGFQLVARLLPTADVADSLALKLRDETPATPRMFATWKESSLRPGETGHYTLAVRDASGRPVERLPVRVWIGKKGERVPEGDAWTQKSQAVPTNALGEVRGEMRAPTLVKGAASLLTLVAETTLEGDAVKAQSTLDVRAPVASAELFPEATALVPGLEQRVFLRLTGDDGEGVAGRFAVKGDGLAAEVDTNKHGEAEFSWRVPETIGASRDQGPCSGGVAATVNITSTSRPAVQTCIQVNRDAEAIVRGDSPVLRVGERVHLAVDARAGHDPAAGYSVVLQSQNGEGVQSAWVDAKSGADFVIGRGAAGVWSVTAAGPRGAKNALLASQALLVAPQVLPRVTARVVGGRAVPGGTVEVEAALDDGAGHPLRGSVSAVLVDARGGSDLTPLLNFDTRRSLCHHVGVEERCDELLRGANANRADEAAAFRRAMVSRDVKALAPVIDPAAHAKEDLQKAFEDVLHSLEGAVLEATADPAKLKDVRRKVGGGWQFNPELFTLVTAAMDPPPVTPGGEPIVLGDLLAVDKQVTFDSVARRVTRLKLFRILSAVRTFKHEHANDRGEPVWREPNAVLRRLVREGTLTEDGLLDPWGGTIAFARATTRPPPFLDILPGYALRAPGPDGALGTGDDVKDPFERVLRSKSPYADAVQEDRLVDAQFDIEVGDSTVSAWETLFTELTGTTLGGTGEGGGGTGSGFGRLGGSGVTRSPSLRGGGVGVSLPRGADFWLAPQRTGPDGKLRFKVPLGAIPTTWRIGVVADSDAGPVATSSLDVEATMPLSVRVDSGAQWIAGDVVEARLDVRNDTAAARAVRLAVTASGVAALAGPQPKAVTVPARGTATAFVRVRATRAGIGQLDVRADASGVPGDQARLDVIVRPAGVGITKARAVWVTNDQELTLPIDQGELPDGKARLVLERGLHRTLSDALHSLGPNHIETAHGALFAAEVARRVERWATAQGATQLVDEARALGDIASARFSSLAVASDPSLAFLTARAASFHPAPEDPKAAKAAKNAAKDSKETSCPAAIPSLYGALLALESSPPRATPLWAACWDQAVAEAIDTVQTSGDAAALARAILALADDPQRSAATGALADKLRVLVALSPNGDVVLPAAARSREGRIVVRAALLRAASLGRAAAHRGAVSAVTLAPWVEVERDAGGGFGSPLATRAAVAALLEAGLTKGGVSTVTVESDGRQSRVAVDAGGRLSIPLDDLRREALTVRVRVSGPPVLARLERQLLRSYAHPPLDAEAPLVLDVVWPKNPSTARTDLLTVTLRKAAPFVSSADIRVPLPAGASLARAQPGALELGGMLYLSPDMRGEDEKVIQVPIRFGLRGQLMAPEATARVTSDDAPRTIAPARPIVVE
jgi:hypothetical protein